MAQVKLYGLLFFVLILSGFSRYRSQSGVEPSRLKQFNITVNFEDYTVKTQMLSQNKSICVNNERSYLWYASQKIIETRGGFDGKLLHGTYRAFYLNNQLKEQGQIRYGLRNREWKYWYADGKLKEVIHWKNGVKCGTYYLYNDYGELMAKSRFKNNKLHGWFYTYNAAGKVSDKKKYRKGDELMPVKKQKRVRKPKPEKEAAAEKRSSEPKRSFFKGWFKSKKDSSTVPPKTEKKKRMVTT